MYSNFLNLCTNQAESFSLTVAISSVVDFELLKKAKTIPPTRPHKRITNVMITGTTPTISTGTCIAFRNMAIVASRVPMPPGVKGIAAT